jgi:hypothetical protein
MQARENAVRCLDDLIFPHTPVTDLSSSRETLGVFYAWQGSNIIICGLWYTGFHVSNARIKCLRAACLLNACLVSTIAAAEGNTSQCAIKGLVALFYTFRWAHAYIQAVPFGAAPGSVERTEVPSIRCWAPFGVCGLMAVPNIHQIFGGNLAAFPHLMRDKA